MQYKMFLLWTCHCYNSPLNVLKERYSLPLSLKLHCLILIVQCISIWTVTNQLLFSTMLSCSVNNPICILWWHTSLLPGLKANIMQKLISLFQLCVGRVVGLNLSTTNCPMPPPGTRQDSTARYRNIQIRGRIHKTFYFNSKSSPK